MKFAPYTSGRLKQLKVGITSYSENKTSLEVVGSVSIGGSITGNITGNVNATSGLSTFTNLNVTGVSTFGGNVAIGTDNVTDPVGVGNTSVLAVGILTAYRLYSTVFGEFTGGSVVADTIVGTSLSVSGIAVTTEIIKDLPIESSDTANLLAGKLVLETGDTLVLSANDASNVKFIGSILETLK